MTGNYNNFKINEPKYKRAYAFLDGQNLFHAVEESFGYSYPNFDIYELANKICLQYGWELIGVKFYTGVPKRSINPYWHEFWRNKLRNAKNDDICIFTRELRKRYESIDIEIPKLFPGNSEWEFVTKRFGKWGEYEFYDEIEKGIDVRIAVDIVRFALKRMYDVALIFSQDQDLSEIAKEIPFIAREQNRWIHIASAFPFSVNSEFPRGIDKTQWIKISKDLYDQCIDPHNYVEKTGQEIIPL
ncbi:MAG: NYN domain-containing protein [Calditrichaeota bacterium]|nr:NYN domain-containing protein [Calditrichota bacterium]